jgi:pyruvate formate lyase activating enzyme
VAEGRLIHAGGVPAKGLVEWYYDPLPTNCVATPVCPAGTGAGWPKFAATDGPERGYANLAVFYRACSLNCLFCQNASFKTMRPTEKGHSAEELARAADDERVTCICYFGGDPAVQMPHALAASKIAVKKAWASGRIMRICFETNATMHPSVADRMAEIALSSGGIVKVDLKAHDDALHRALTGSSNAYTLDNFSRMGRRMDERPDIPLLVASTLLVPGYIDPKEVSHIARFIASVNPSIPYVLLGFYPQFEMMDVPPTPRSLAEECFEAALAEGIHRVFIGNEHLLW